MTRRTSAWAFLAGSVIALVAATCAVAQELPRVVSLDYCADQFVLALADRSQILALSPDAGAEFSALRAEAEGVPRVRQTAEDVVSLQPDLVVRSYGGDGRALALFERLGMKVHQLGYASSFEAVAAAIADTAAALGRPEAGAALIAQMQGQLAAAADGPGGRPRVLYVTPGGVTAGAGTLIDAMLSAAGFENLAARDGASGWTALPLEALVLSPPELIVAGFFETRANQLDPWSAGHHPVMQHLLETTPTVRLEGAMLTCSAWFMADAALSARRQADALIVGEVRPW